MTLSIDILKAEKKLILILVFVFFSKNLLSVILSKQLFSGIILFLIISLYGLSFFSKKQISGYELIIFYCLIILSIFSFCFSYKGFASIYFILSFIQIFIIICSFRVVETNTIYIYDSPVLWLKKSIILFSVFGFIEFFIPTSIKAFALSGYNMLVYGDFSIPVAYYLGDSSLSVLRIGSLFFEPVTFSFITGIGFLFLLESNEKRWIAIFVLVVHLMTMGKLAIFSTTVALLCKLLKKYSAVLLFLVPVIVGLYFVLSFSHIDFNMPSMANHLNGLVYGFEGALNSPIVGNGIGSAGFLVAIATTDQLVSPFVGESTLVNGNESAIGILLFQFGFIFTILFISYFVYQIFKSYRLGNYQFAGYSLGVVISFFLSESILSIVVIFIYLLLGKVTNEKQKCIYY